MKKEIQDDNFKQDANELFYEALKLWEKEGYLTEGDENSPFYNIESDPIVKFFMIALAHQTNIIKEEIFNFKNNLLDEFTENIIPYNLIKPIPAFSIIQTAKDKTIENECYANAETPFIIEKENGIGKSKEKEIFQFIPLLETKIINAQILNVQKIESNKFSVRMTYNEINKDLSGITFYFPKSVFSDLTISINNKVLPLIKPNDFEKFPFVNWLDNEGITFNKYMYYGSLDYWKDIFASQNIQFFIVDSYDITKINFNKINLEFDLLFEFTTFNTDFDLDVSDIKLNCVPIINVERGTVTLSNEEPIKKLSNESVNIQSIFEREDSTMSTNQKLFLNLLPPSQFLYEKEIFTLRRFGMERFNKNELLIKINNIVNLYVSDYYAYREIEGLKDGSKLKSLNIALRDIVDDIKKEGVPNNGIYLVLNHNNNLTEQNKSIEVSYLVTDGSKANEIKITSIIHPSIEFDKNETYLLIETSGGKDEETNKETKKSIAQYYFLTKDRIVTKSDIRFFCFKELSSKFLIDKEGIEKIDIKNEITTSPKGKYRYIHIEIIFKKTPDFANGFTVDFVENHLQRTIEIRSTILFPIKVNIH